MLGLLLGVGLVVMACQPVGPTPPPPGLSALSFDDLKGNASSIPYNDLFRNNEQYVGQLVYYQAQLIQVVDAGKDRYQLRANVTKGRFLWDDTVFLSYAGPRLLEDDVIEFVGTVVGVRTYTAVLGNRVTIPDISVVKARMVNHDGKDEGQGPLSTPAYTTPRPTASSLTSTPPTAPNSTSTTMATPTAIPIPIPTSAPTPTPAIQLAGDGKLKLDALVWTESWFGGQVVIGVVKNMTEKTIPGVAITVRFLNQMESRVVETKDASVLLNGEVGPEETVPFVAALPENGKVRAWDLLEIQTKVDDLAHLFGKRVAGLDVQDLEGVRGDNSLGLAIQGGVRGVIYNGTDQTLGGTEILQGFAVAVVGYDAENRVVFVGDSPVRTVLQSGWSTDFEVSVPGSLWGDPQLATWYKGRVLVRPAY